MMMIRPIIGIIHIAAVLENIRVIWRNIDGLLRRRRILGIRRIGGGRGWISRLLRRSRVRIGGGRGTLLLHRLLVHVGFRDRRGGGGGGVRDHCRLVVDWCRPLRLCSRSLLLLLMCRYCCCCRVVRFVRAVSARWQVVSWCRWRDCWCSWWCCC